MLPTAVNGKLIEILGINIIAPLILLGIHPTEARAFLINAAFSGIVVIMLTPAIVLDQTQVELEFLGGEILL
jgi:hypothetical protein